MNRRDTVNPEGGGAEVYTLEIAKGLVRRGAEVTIYSSAFEGGKSEETLEGVRHLRRGGELTVHMYAFLYALRRRRSLDLIIDEYNGLGFMGFLLPRSMMLIHQLYCEFWFRELGRIGGAIPYVVEKILLRLYRKVPSVTVSNSTLGDLVAMGFRDVRVVMNALKNKPLENVPEKEEVPTLIFFSRLRSTKRPEDAIRILRLVREQVPETKLWFVGRGPDEPRLREMARDMEGVTFYGYLDEDRKFEVLRRAHLLLAPGVREGFGINIIEAASQGTPSVGYNIHGLRDSIRDGDTGFLAGGPEEAAARVLVLLGDNQLYGQMARRCLEYAREFDWDKRAGEFYAVVEDIIGNRGRD
jgi:glycosyltransferase involved in cell wall biosynthesis